MRSAVAERMSMSLSHRTERRAPNKSIIQQVVQANIQRAVRLRNTISVQGRDFFQPEEGTRVTQVISCRSDSEIRRWMQAMTGTYPVAT